DLTLFVAVARNPTHRQELLVNVDACTLGIHYWNHALPLWRNWPDTENTRYWYSCCQMAQQLGLPDSVQSRLLNGFLTPTYDRSLTSCVSAEHTHNPHFLLWVWWVLPPWTTSQTEDDDQNEVQNVTTEESSRAPSRFREIWDAKTSEGE